MRDEMEIITIECPTCRGKLHVDAEMETGFCLYCRGEVVIKQPESEQAEVAVEPVNHDFQAKFAIAKHHEELYKDDKMTFFEVMKSYDDAGQVGAHHWEYWHVWAKFFADYGIKEIEKQDPLMLASRKAFIDIYRSLMDSAIRQAKDDSLELVVEQEQEISRLQEILENHEEYISDSKEPFIERRLTPKGDLDSIRNDLKEIKEMTMSPKWWIPVLFGIIVWIIMQSS